MKLIFRGATIRYADLRRDEEAGLFTRLHLTTAFSEPVRDAMKWGPPPDGFQSAKLDGCLTATHMILTPDGRELKQHELQLDVTEVSDFQFFRVKNDDGESTSTELRFIVRTPVNGAGALIEQYMRHIGGGAAQLRVNYEKQDELPFDPERTKAATGETCVDCENKVPLRDGDPSTHASGQPCAMYDGAEDGAPLAPAAVMGGTHQAKRPRLIQKGVQ